MTALPQWGKTTFNVFLNYILVCRFNTILLRAIVDYNWYSGRTWISISLHWSLSWKRRTSSHRAGPSRSKCKENVSMDPDMQANTLSFPTCLIMHRNN